MVIAFLAASTLVALAFDGLQGIQSDSTTIAATLALFAALALATMTARALNNGVLLGAVTTFTIGYGLSTLLLLWDREYYSPLLARIPTSAEFTVAITIAIGVVAISAIGLTLGGLRSRPSARGEFLGSWFTYRRRLFVVALGVIATSAILTITSGVRVFGKEGGPLAFLAKVFDPELAIFTVLFVAIRYRRHLERRDWWMMGLCMSAFLVTTLIQGSRGGLLIPGIFAVAILFSVHGDFKIRTNHLVTALFAVALTAMVVHPLGTFIRDTRVEGEAGQLEDALASDSVFEALRPIFRRESRMESLIVVTTQDDGQLAAIWSWGSSIQRTVGSLVPGTGADKISDPLIHEIYIRVFKRFPDDAQHAESLSSGAEAWAVAPGVRAFLLIGIWAFASAALVRGLQRSRSDLLVALGAAGLLHLAIEANRAGFFEARISDFIRWTMMIAAIHAATLMSLRPNDTSQPIREVN